MTQNTEQNARTRDEQALKITQAIGGKTAPGDMYSWFRAELALAEARGAKEQRRKDADKWVATQLLSASKVIDDKNANVAALEARVKSLEDAAENVVIAFGMGWDVDGVLDVLAKTLKETNRA